MAVAMAVATLLAFCLIPVPAVAVFHLFKPLDIESLVQRVKTEAPELFRDAPETIRSMGYPVETHRVHTEDGYVLTMHRISHGRTPDRAGARRRPPVLLQHGIFGCTDTWIVGGPGVAPALLMADKGYDVWIGNSRGNYYSREHKRMTTQENDFWKFSWHEMGMYDIPAFIDRILETTIYMNLTYVAHSMGSNMLYALVSAKPEYNNKILLEVALAPAVYWNHARSRIVRFLIRDIGRVQSLMESKNTYEILRPSDVRTTLIYYACRNNSSLQRLCAAMSAFVIGESQGQNITKVPFYLARVMTATSGWTILHLTQNAKTGKFCQLDFGEKVNMEKYGNPEPPEYDLKKVSFPVALYTSSGDDLVPEQGVDRLAQELPNVVEVYKVPAKHFNHLDFVLNENLAELLMKRVIRTMDIYQKRYRTKQQCNTCSRSRRVLKIKRIK